MPYTFEDHLHNYAVWTADHRHLSENGGHPSEPWSLHKESHHSPADRRDLIKQFVRRPPKSIPRPSTLDPVIRTRLLEHGRPNKSTKIIRLDPRGLLAPGILIEFDRLADFHRMEEYSLARLNAYLTRYNGLACTLTKWFQELIRGHENIIPFALS